MDERPVARNKTPVNLHVDLIALVDRAVEGPWGYQSRDQFVAEAVRDRLMGLGLMPKADPKRKA